MRKNLAKHAAKKLPLAKRVLALCFALIFVCSCLLPAFANGAGTDFTDLTEDTSAVVEESVDTVEDTAPAEDLSVSEDLTVDDGAATLDDGFGVDTMDESFGVDDGVAALDDDYAVDDGVAALDDDYAVDDGASTLDDDPISQPVGGIDLPIAVDPTPVVDSDDTPKEGAVNVTTDKDGNIVYEYDTSDVTFDDDFVVSQPDGDHALDKVDAAFAIPTNTYRFWLSEKDSYDLAEIASDAAAADLTEDEYLSLHGESKGLFHMMYVADGANLADYKFTSPTSVDDPSGNSRTFAGWYTIDDLGDKHDFKFDDYLYTSKSKTVDVYAKWKKPEATKSVTLDGQSISFKVEGATTLNIETLDADTQKKLESELVQKIDPEEYNTLYAVDISPKDEGGLELEQTSKVTISGLDLTSAADVKVFHQGFDLEELKATVTSDGDLTFTTNGFSPFAILVADLSKATSNDSSDADDRMAEYANDDGSYAVYANGSDVTLKKNGTATLSGSWGNSHKWTSDNYNVVAITSNQNSQSVTIKGVSTGSAKITHTYSSNWYSDTETFNVTVEALQPTLTPLYLYVLKPNREWTETNTYKSSEDWFGVGVAQIYVTDMTQFNEGTECAKGVSAVAAAVADPNKINMSPYSGSFEHHYEVKGNSTTYKGSGVTSNYSNKKLFPDLCKKDGASENCDENSKHVTYTYWDGKNIDEKPTGAYYTITWVNLLRSGGAPANGYNTGALEASAGGGDWGTIHLDGVVHYSDMISVEFQTIEPGKTEYEPLRPDIYNAEFSEGTSESKVVRPEQFPGDKEYDISGKTEDHKGYTWSGWYKDRELKVKANFDGNLEEEHTIYYGKWIPNTQNITITKQVTGLFGDKDREFNFSVNLSPANADVTATKNFRDGRTETVTNFNSFTLRHNDSITLYGVPVDTVITITESGASDYSVTATGTTTGDEQTGENASFTYKVVANSASTQSLEDGESDIALMSATEEVVPNNSITITNTFDAPVDNGVLLDTLPYLVILAVVVGGAVLLIARKHKHDDE